jgi:threonylcarbamoyladenosine tRNA methylthiotransferase MtaB
LGANEKFNIFDHLDFEETKPQVKAGDIEEVHEFTSSYSLGERTRTFLKVQDGCDYNCTFCTIPLARGASRSDTVTNVLEQAKEIAGKGVKEIVLTGVNIGDFGKREAGNNQETFLDLVKALDEVTGIDRFRISSIEPNLLNDEIIAFTATSKRFMPHFHIPLQSGNDRLLGLMRRRYKRDLYVDRVRQIKELMPHACIGVDVIVGFPGESHADFLDTYNFLNELDISYLHVFTYSERENTLAIEMDGVVSAQERRERSQQLRSLSEKKKRAFYASQQGACRKVLFEDAQDDLGIMHGFSDNYVKVATPYREDLANQISEVELGPVNAQGVVAINMMTSVL